MAMADIEKLERVFTNLVDNAIRHCQQDDRISIDIKHHEKQLKVAVVDSGVGISEEDIPYVFDAHYRATNSAKGSRTNSGLGLAITQRIINLHHSCIQVESKLGEGTSFWFLLDKA
jgi:signal transduction histidine kinase